MKISIKNKLFKKPLEYKKLNIYPVTILDAEDFYEHVQCLMIQQSNFEDVEIARMSYFKFIIFLNQFDENEVIFEKVKSLYRLILKLGEDDVVDYVIDEKDRCFLLINDIKLSERDFDKIKTIIGELNMLDLDDEFVNPEFKKAIEEARELMRKKNRSADLEQQIIAYHCKIGISYDEIMNLTIYQFHKALERISHMSMAEAIMSARFSGMVSFKDESTLPHWLSHIETKGKYEDVLMKKSEFTEQTKNWN